MSKPPRTHSLILTVEDACELYRVLTNLTGELARQGSTPQGLNLDKDSTKALQRAFETLTSIETKEGSDGRS